jgi:hypothetical protein
MGQVTSSEYKKKTAVPQSEESSPEKSSSAFDDSANSLDDSPDENSHLHKRLKVRDACDSMQIYYIKLRFLTFCGMYNM